MTVRLLVGAGLTVLVGLLVSWYVSPSIAVVVAVLMMLLIIFIHNKLQESELSSNVDTSRSDNRAYQQVFHEIAEFMLECRSSIDNINATQIDAVNTIGRSFGQLKELLDLNNALREKITKTNEKELWQTLDIQKDITQMTARAEGLQRVIYDLFQGLQFGDINGQHLNYVSENITFIEKYLEDLWKMDIDEEHAKLQHKREEMREYRATKNNPVSTRSMQCGNVDLF